MSRYGREGEPSKTVAALGTMGFVWSAVAALLAIALVYSLVRHSRTGRGEDVVEYPYTEVIDAPDSPVDSIVYTKDSTLYYKDGVSIWFSLRPGVRDSQVEKMAR